MRRKQGPFSGETRAVDGCIVTFELPDGTIHTERFNQLMSRKQKGKWNRTVTRIGDNYLTQVVNRADELDAKVLCISTPQTILTDLQGTRRSMEALTVRSREETPFPEIRLLAKVGRGDLFKEPTGGQPRSYYREVQTRRPSHAGRTDQ